MTVRRSPFGAQLAGGVVAPERSADRPLSTVTLE